MPSLASIWENLVQGHTDLFLNAIRVANISKLGFWKKHGWRQICTFCQFMCPFLHSCGKFSLSFKLESSCSIQHSIFSPQKRYLRNSLWLLDSCEMFLVTLLILVKQYTIKIFINNKIKNKICNVYTIKFYVLVKLNGQNHRWWVKRKLLRKNHKLPDFAC